MTVRKHKALPLSEALRLMNRYVPQQGRPRVLFMPGQERYQPETLKKYLGYDQWARWLVIVEWYWLETLAEIGVMPQEDARLLTKSRLVALLVNINTKDQDLIEKETKHDILALLALMRANLPDNLHRWLHYCATSYDIINTAYALQMKVCYEVEFIPKLEAIDALWREKICDTASVLQAGRTHLQTALPVTVGCWLANLHNRFVTSARRASVLAREIPGKFSGAVGTSASQRVLMLNHHDAEARLMHTLGLAKAEVSTQVTPPEAVARFYYELVLLSGTLANLGEDTRILQSSQFGEIRSASSSSSAMSHKEANPIVAENIAGMHTLIVTSHMNITLTLVTDLQRDLRASSVMRAYSEIMVYVYQQMLNTERLLKSILIDETRCRENFDRQGRLVVAELLHLFLQREGVPEAHHFVNKEVVPRARELDCNLFEAVKSLVSAEGPITKAIINRLEQDLVHQFLVMPETYLGDAVSSALREAQNKL